jgi:hypothetical protein
VCLRAALQVYTRAAFPYDWASPHNALGVAYGHRIRGNRAANLDRAVAHFRLAGRVWTREAYPGNWTLVMRNLGEAYSERIRGDRRVNQELGIACLHAVFDDEVRERYPYDWARAHFLVAASYRDRLTGSRVENLHSAIAHYEASLEVYTRRVSSSKTAGWPWRRWPMRAHVWMRKLPRNLSPFDSRISINLSYWMVGDLPW